MQRDVVGRPNGAMHPETATRTQKAMTCGSVAIWHQAVMHMIAPRVRPAGGEIRGVMVLYKVVADASPMASDPDGKHVVLSEASGAGREVTHHIGLPSSSRSERTPWPSILCGQSQAQN